MSSVPAAERSPSARPALSRDRILRAAVALADREGLDALSMRRLGAELGVEAMSLYHHVANKQALLDGIVEWVVDSMDTSGMLEPGPWQERLKDGFRAYRRLAHAHPAVFPLVGRRPVRTLAALRPVELALGLLHDAGCPPGAALRAFRTLSHFAYGHALSEIRGMAMDSASQATEPEVLEAQAKQFPNLTRVMLEAASSDHNAEFEESLDVIIAGLVTTYRLKT
ncbi:MAG: Transcriptional regulator, AcrR family [uncultured Phycisphaerae bacterium]|uniref:Transcriptional regulator, AcrR family n=1 Tax=uncultured Phycisphaerae bacterium TaxID=904963 RepID=A0A6J4P4V0_9BACT|nr:MAG: Transcriptional regulator, AcrR family [uncultured Phycisphaerae bacterium]